MAASRPTSFLFGSAIRLMDVSLVLNVSCDDGSYIYMTLRNKVLLFSIVVLRVCFFFWRCCKLLPVTVVEPELESRAKSSLQLETLALPNIFSKSKEIAVNQ